MKTTLQVGFLIFADIKFPAMQNILYLAKK